MDIAVGDTILTRKQHPCGAASFEVLRVGMDFKIRCTGCGREVMLPRANFLLQTYGNQRYSIHHPP